MSPIPRTGLPDSTLAFLREGYPFISRRCDRLGSDAFETRLTLRPVVCVRGADAAEMFYEPGRFTRRGALPPHVLRLLQDKGSVATLDGAAHARRKAMFMGLAGPEGLARLQQVADLEIARHAERWRAAGRIRLHDAFTLLFTQIGLAWCGLRPDTDALAEYRNEELVAMVDGAGSVGLRALRGLGLRRRTEEWARVLIGRVREGSLAVDEGTPLAVIARHEDDEGQPLDLDTAAVELINILRPTTAVAWYGVFAALALHRNPAEAQAARDDDAFRLAFVDEVRRLYPFFPVVAGRALQPFVWYGREFARHDWVVLDLWGTNHHPVLWPEPDRFDPGRFLNRTPTPYDLVPQGGGHHHDGHRCPGEAPTRLLLSTLVAALIRLRYDVPPQDMAVDLTRFPTLPRSGLVVENMH